METNRQTATGFSILLVEDHPGYRDHVRKSLLDFSNIGRVDEVDNGIQCLKVMEKRSYDFVIMDIQMPEMDGIECVGKIKQRWPEQKVIVLSGFSGYGFAKRLLPMGVVGYLLKDSPPVENEANLKAIILGNERVIAKGVQRSIRDRDTGQPIKFGRSELEVLALICEEMNTQEIADALHLSFHTVKTHRKSLLEKTHSKNTVGLVKWAIEHGLDHL